MHALSWADVTSVTFSFLFISSSFRIRPGARVGCSNRCTAGCKLSFYRFPTDPHRKALWIAKINRRIGLRTTVHEYVALYGVPFVSKLRSMWHFIFLVRIYGIHDENLLKSPLSGCIYSVIYSVPSRWTCFHWTSLPFKSPTGIY